ncbi:TonB-dependent siderophore receptor [Lysobacter oculi]|uniref:TonB-dependent siderophore receptor n=1 Tax=Solilutibacter oculi TaxID=2698682 RepID=A0A344J6A8_9GAMM|nr:TonB-dependent siderophore receptor [Lysobacter oculi]AXA84568.1 TonB-dependent siderophore receptor [Lysobacter oculi]
MSSPFFISRRPLVAAILLGLSLPVLADDAAQLDRVVVKGSRYLPEYQARDSRSATKTDTPLVNVPQAATVVTEELIRDQAMTGLPEVLRYVPGAGVAQGEGNRDTAVMRGNSTTADFFVDGMRDDTQYIRDIYNTERVEALKGPNAMIFGRGGSGGIINRVSKQADGREGGALSLQYGNWNRKRGTLDWQTKISESAAFRVNAVAEESEGFRDGFEISRRGINPTMRFGLGEHTQLDLSFEHFRDDRVADRGVPSLNGRPIDVDPSTFFGSPELSPVWARVNAFDAALVHDFGNGAELRNHFRWADYDKFYQNVFASGTVMDPVAGLQVTLSAYNNLTTRRNWLNQTDLEFDAATGNIRHRLLVGAELGRQDTDNLRMNGAFPAGNRVTLANPRFTGQVVFTPNRENSSQADTFAVYAQDQIEFSPAWMAVVGVRYDRVSIEMDDITSGQHFSSRDGMWSPRAGLIYKPRKDMSFYGSYSMAFQPRAGEQLSSLSASTQSLDPEKFINKELGWKWEVNDQLSLSVAAYQLDRRNVATTDPADPTRMVLVDGQRARGVELGLAGRITERWQVMGGYAWQQGELLSAASATAPAGNELAQLPRHSASLWNRFDVTPTFGFGIGAIHRGSFYASTDNTVTVPGFTRLDGALFWKASEQLQLQLNVENLLDKEYFATAHSNQSISPGAPRGATLTARFTF